MKQIRRASSFLLLFLAITALTGCAGALSPAEVELSLTYEGNGYSFWYPEQTQVQRIGQYALEMQFPGHMGRFRVARIISGESALSLSNGLSQYVLPVEENRSQLIEETSLFDFEYDNALYLLRANAPIDGYVHSALLCFVHEGDLFTLRLSTTGTCEEAKSLLLQIVNTFHLSS